MSVLLSLNAREEMTAEHAGDVPITLLTFSHPGLEEPVRFSSDQTECVSIDPYLMGTRSRGQTFIYVPMAIVQPGDDEQMAPELKISISAVDHAIIDVIRASRLPATCTEELVYAASPDIVEMSLDHFEAVSAPYDEAQATLVLSQESFWDEPYPSGVITPNWFPGAHE